MTDFASIDAPGYVALSYTWGNPFPVHTIRLNGKRFVVRENLYNFLKAFRKGEEETQSMHYLWVDQICIDQGNMPERSHQVGMMAEIYSNSAFVISWLGIESYDLYLRESFHAINTFLRNPYFTRLWIVQEVLLAKNVYFMCGNVWITWKRLQDTVNSVGSTPYEYLHNARSLFRDTKPSSDQVGRTQPRNELYQVIHRYSSLECVDPRDKVYGLLGLVDGTHEVPLVDHDKPPREIYLDTVRILLSRWMPERYLHHVELLDAAKALGRNMGFEADHVKALDLLWKDAADFREKSSELRTCLVDAVGFEHDIPGLSDRWWVQIQGWKRYRVPGELVSHWISHGWERVG